MKKDDLLNSSRRLMHLALQDIDSDVTKADVVVLHAGIATEHLLKAYLCSIHPSLVVDHRDLNSLLHAAEHPELASKPLPMIKTIGTVEAFKRVSKILNKDQLLVSEAEFQPIADARNGVAHIGIHDTTQLEPLLSTTLKLTDSLLAALEADADKYWAHFKPLHDKILDTQRHMDQVRIESLKIRATKVFSDRFAHLDVSEKDDAIAALTLRPTIHGEALINRDCPVCESKAWLAGFQGTSWSPEDGAIEILTPQAFGCGACEFMLNERLLRYFPDLYEDAELGPADMNNDLWLALDAIRGEVDMSSDDIRRRVFEELLQRKQTEGD